MCQTLHNKLPFPRQVISQTLHNKDSYKELSQQEILGPQFLHSTKRCCRTLKKTYVVESFLAKLQVIGLQLYERKSTSRAFNRGFCDISFSAGQPLSACI